MTQSSLSGHRESDYVFHGGEIAALTGFHRLHTGQRWDAILVQPISDGMSEPVHSAGHLIHASDDESLLQIVRRRPGVSPASRNVLDYIVDYEPIDHKCLWIAASDLQSLLSGKSIAKTISPLSSSPFRTLSPNAVTVRDAVEALARTFDDSIALIASALRPLRTARHIYLSVDGAAHAHHGGEVGALLTHIITTGRIETLSPDGRLEPIDPDRFGWYRDELAEALQNRNPPVYVSSLLERLSDDEIALAKQRVGEDKVKHDRISQLESELSIAKSRIADLENEARGRSVPVDANAQEAEKSVEGIVFPYKTKTLEVLAQVAKSEWLGYDASRQPKSVNVAIEIDKGLGKVSRTGKPTRAAEALAAAIRPDDVSESDGRNSKRRAKK